MRAAAAVVVVVAVCLVAGGALKRKLGRRDTNLIAFDAREIGAPKGGCRSARNCEPTPTMRTRIERGESERTEGAKDNTQMRDVSITGPHIESVRLLLLLLFEARN